MIREDSFFIKLLDTGCPCITRASSSGLPPSQQVKNLLRRGQTRSSFSIRSARASSNRHSQKPLGAAQCTIRRNLTSLRPRYSASPRGANARMIAYNLQTGGGWGGKLYFRPLFFFFSKLQNGSFELESVGSLVGRQPAQTGTNQEERQNGRRRMCVRSVLCRFLRITFCFLSFFVHTV